MKLTLGEVLSFTTKKLLTDPSNLMELVKNIAGCSFPSELLGVVAGEIREHILWMYPYLENAVPPWQAGEGAQWPEWLEEQRKIYGDEFEVEILPESVREDIAGYVSRSPLVINEQGIVHKEP